MLPIRLRDRGLPVVYFNRVSTAVDADAVTVDPVPGMTDFIVELIARGGYLGIVFLMALENVFPPIPSEVIMGLGGMAVGRGHMTLGWLIAAGTLGTVIGTTIAMTGIVLALAAIIAPCRVDVPKDYLVLFVAAPLVMLAFAITGFLTVPAAVVLVLLFVAFVGWIGYREYASRRPVFRNAELYEQLEKVGAGAAGVVIAATHAILSGPAVDRLKNCSAAEVIVTDTLPIPADRMFDKLTVLSIAPLISKAIREVFEDGSVTSLFDGQA